MLRVNSDLRSILKSGMIRSMVSLGIKVGAAGLTYLTYVVLSRTMDGTEYGHFAFGLSLATILAVAAGMGQQTAVVRFWPEERVAGRPELARRAITAGAALTLIGGVGLALVLFVGVSIAGWIAPGSFEMGQFYGAALLLVPLALAEFCSAALRAQGSVWTALVPRDILWRVATPLVVILLFGFGIMLSGWSALWITALLLTVALALQMLVAGKLRYVLEPRLEGLGDYWRQHAGLSRWFLAAALLDTLALNADVILVGLLVDPLAAGLYFNAFRTAGLMTLFTYAMTLVIAPMISHHFHSGDYAKAQAVATLTAWSGTLFSLVMLIGFLLFGHQVLALFGSDFVDGQTILVLLATGLLFDAATGPTRVAMMMTGHHRAYVALFGLCTLAGMAGMALAIPVYGLEGAAVANMLARIASQLAVAIYCRTRIGIDTTVLGGLLMRRRVA